MNPPDLPPVLHDLRASLRNRGYDLRIVGGFVRDLVRGESPRDIDLVTDARPSIVLTTLLAMGAPPDSRGVLTILPLEDGRMVDIVSLEPDHFLEGEGLWRMNLKMRDFTMNAMAMTFEGEVIDPLDGRADALAGRVRFCRNAIEAIDDDPVRAIRYARFVARFRTPADEICHEALRFGALTLSRYPYVERVFKELDALNGSPHGQAGMELLEKFGVLAAIKHAFPKGFARRNPVEPQLP